jgi:hypothetical protein
VHEVVALLAGLEVWALGLLGILSWKAAKRKWKLALEPVMVTQIVALLVLSFYFSYMYNMGLVVRQRLMCFPALLFIYFFPVLASQRSRIPAARRNLVRRHRPALVMNAAWQSRPRRESPFQSR